MYVLAYDHAYEKKNLSLKKILNYYTFPGNFKNNG